MSIALATVLILTGLSVIGLLATYAIILRGLPDSIRLQDVPRSVKKFHEELPLIAFNLTVLIGGAGLTIPFIEHKITRVAPPWYIVALEVALIFIVEDVFFYGWHRLIHENKYLYRTIHRIHHKAYAPLPLEFIYVHPIEWMVGALGPVLGICLVMFIHGGTISAATFLTFAFARQAHEMNLHSGAKSYLSKHIPFMGRTEIHDFHHRNPTKGNYASILSVWDKVFGTATLK